MRDIFVTFSILVIETVWLNLEQDENIFNTVIKTFEVVNVNGIVPALVMFPLLKIRHPENIEDILDTFATLEIEIVWLNDVQFKNIFKMLVKAVEVGNVKFFDPASVGSPLLKIVHPLNMFDIVVTFSILVIETVWLKLEQDKNIDSTVVNWLEVVNVNGFVPALVMFPLLNITQPENIEFILFTLMTLLK